MQVRGESSAVQLLNERLEMSRSLEKLHFPVGGRRYRPALEDIVEFLIAEGYVQHREGWREVIGFHRTTRELLFRRWFSSCHASNLAAFEVVKTPYRAPRANGFAERWVMSVRHECLDHLLIVGRRHLEHVATTYVDHYSGHRPHPRP